MHRTHPAQLPEIIAPFDARDMPVFQDFSPNFRPRKWFYQPIAT
jgi:hypothetical protein